MEWLNYHHLLYFWMVAREGSLGRASQELRLAKPTLSGQIRRLEQALGEKLFARHGRGLALTEAGRLVFRYAEEIFALGSELKDALKGRVGNPLRLVVGVADVLPKPIVRRLLQPALALGQPVRIVCREDRSAEGLLAELAVHRLDLVLADLPTGPGLAVRAWNHLLGECGTSFFAARAPAAAARRGFPRALDGAPLMMPGAGAALRRALEQWLQSQSLRPRVVGEFDDPALMNVFGQDGAGIFAGPTVIEQEIRERYQVQVVGRVESIRQRFYAISIERRLRHPAVIAICESARKDLFA